MKGFAIQTLTWCVTEKRTYRKSNTPMKKITNAVVPVHFNTLTTCSWQKSDWSSKLLVNQNDLECIKEMLLKTCNYSGLLASSAYLKKHLDFWSIGCNGNQTAYVPNILLGVLIAFSCANYFISAVLFNGNEMNDWEWNRHFKQ